MRSAIVLVLAGCSGHFGAGAVVSSTGAVGGEVTSGFGSELDRKEKRVTYLMLNGAIGGTPDGITLGGSLSYEYYQRAHARFDGDCSHGWGHPTCRRSQSLAYRLGAGLGIRYDPDATWATLGAHMTVLRIAPRYGGLDDPCAPPGGQDSAICNGKGVDLGVQLLATPGGRTAVVGSLSFVFDMATWFL